MPRAGETWHTKPPQRDDAIRPQGTLTLKIRTVCIPTPFSFLSLFPRTTVAHLSSTAAPFFSTLQRSFFPLISLSLNLAFKRQASLHYICDTSHTVYTPPPPYHQPAAKTDIHSPSRSYSLHNSKSNHNAPPVFWPRSPIHRSQGAQWRGQIPPREDLARLHRRRRRRLGDLHAHLEEAHVLRLHQEALLLQETISPVSRLQHAVEARFAQPSRDGHQGCLRRHPARSSKQPTRRRASRHRRRPGQEAPELDPELDEHISARSYLQVYASSLYALCTSLKASRCSVVSMLPSCSTALTLFRHDL